MEYGKLRGVWFHVPNETVIADNLDLLRLEKKRAMGMVPGAPDLVFLKKDGCLQIELKYGKNGLSANQKKFCELSQKQDVPYVLCRSWEDVRDTLVEHGFLVNK
jgi:hypothetical protein